MEARLGTDFSSVRIHVGREAPDIGALAFTLGDTIAIAPGRYAPESAAGRELLGHELAHVVQQRQGRVSNPFGGGPAVVQDPGLEAEADRMGRRAAAVVGPPQSAVPETTVTQPRSRIDSGRPPALGNGQSVQCVVKRTWAAGEEIITREFALGWISGLLTPEIPNDIIDTFLKNSEKKYDIWDLFDFHGDLVAWCSNVLKKSNHENGFINMTIDEAEKDLITRATNKSFAPVNEMAIAYFPGTKNKVAFGEPPKAGKNVSVDPKYLGDLKDWTVTHNHPKGGPLSTGDITNAILNNMKEIRAVGKNGVFSFKRPPEGWFANHPKIKEEYQKAGNGETKNLIIGTYYHDNTCIVMRTMKAKYGDAPSDSDRFDAYFAYVGLLELKKFAEVLGDPSLFSCPLKYQKDLENTMDTIRMEFNQRESIHKEEEWKKNRDAVLDNLFKGKNGFAPQKNLKRNVSAEKLLVKGTGSPL